LEALMMRRLLSGACILALSLAVSLPSAAAEEAQGEQITAASVCDVAMHPESYADQEVLLRGHLVSDFHHAAFISDTACPDDGIMLGFSDADVIGGESFDAAVYITGTCIADGLYFTVRGRIERQHVWHLDRWVVAASEFSDIRRQEGSTCPLTMREFVEQRMQ
jgi:hypothetical protein